MSASRFRSSSTFLVALLSVSGSLLGACVGVSSSTECLDGADCEENGEDGRGERPGERDDAGTRPGSDADEGDDDGGTEPVFVPCDQRTCDEVSLAGESLPDWDADGIPDCIEGYSDIDGDGTANCDDGDADGDSIPDNIEGRDDVDGDGIPGALDPDFDGDGIQDRWEGTADTDLDGVPDYRDLDSDDDGTPDAREFGRAPGDTGQPIDRDSDGFPDYIDLDSDGDGLPDADEAVGCPTTPNRDQPDSDGDNYSDLIEVAFGSNPCNTAEDIRGLVDFFFELPYLGDLQSDTLQFGTTINRGDVFFNMDTTGSMGDEIDTLKSSLSGTIIPALASSLIDGAYGVGHFDDFPCDGYGGGSDVPFGLLQRMTTNASVAQAGVDRIPRHGGGDTPESGVEALYQIATGAGTNDCRSGIVPPFNPDAGVTPESDGRIGGVGFRSGSVPIVIHITDAPTQARDERGYPYGASRAQALDALRAIGARVVGVASGGNAAVPDLRGIGEATGSRVPPCAWDAARPAGCGAGQCCTGQNGNGQAPDADGLCTLVFQVDGNGRGLDSSIVSGVQALVSYAPITVTTRVRRDEDEFLPDGSMIDTSLFIADIIAVDGVGPSTTCGANPTPTDFDGDGTLDGFTNVTPGSLLYFEVQARNTHVLGDTFPQVFLTFIDVLGNGVAVLDTQEVSILVPPDIKQ